jgi:hypothetical protein
MSFGEVVYLAACRETFMYAWERESWFICPPPRPINESRGRKECQGAVFGMCFGSVSNLGFHVGMIVGTG